MLDYESFQKTLDYDFSKYDDKSFAAYLKGSLIRFTMYFYKLRTGNDFKLPFPAARECHYITVSRELTKVFNMQDEYDRLYLAMPPRHGKSELLINFMAWCYAHYADCNFLYISYSSELAAKHTYTLKQIMEHPRYRELFRVKIKRDSSAKDNFTTTGGGTVRAFGSSGSITGQDAGRTFSNRFSGAVIIDDIHKPDEVFSKLMRERVWSNYENTIRPRAPGKVPIIFLGHRLHQEDTPSYLLEGRDIRPWKKVILPALDAVDNVLCEDIISRKELHEMREKSPYTFWSQYQQTPVAAGGNLYQAEHFPILEQMPKILATFMTIDTAETSNTINDASVFSLWGLYKIETQGMGTDVYGLHWLACDEVWIEPKDLPAYFNAFYQRALTFPTKPSFAAIEKKSTGVTLLSVLKELRGLTIREIERNASSGSKTNRFLEMQYDISSRLISLPYGAQHTKKCIEHMCNITGNDTHARDDICDTVVDAIAVLRAKEAFFPLMGQNTNDLNVLGRDVYQQSKQHQERLKTWMR